MPTLRDNNITTTLVANILGENSHDIGTLCKSSRINPWSRHKPVIFPHDNVDAYPDWYRGVDGNCGFTIPRIARVTDLITTTINWTYNRPTGGASAPFRIGDFRSYTTDAELGIRTNIRENIKINLLKEQYLALHLELVDIGDFYTLTWSDFKNSFIKNLYFTVGISTTSFLFYQSANSVDALTANSTISNGGTSIYVPARYFGVRTYNMFLFLSDTPFNWVNATTGNQYALPTDSNNKTGQFQLIGQNISDYEIELTQISYALNGVYRPISDIATDAWDSPYLSMRSLAGTLYVKGRVKFKSGSGSAVSIKSSELSAYLLGGTFSTAEWTVNYKDTVYMYDANKNRIEGIYATSDTEFYLHLEHILLLDANGNVDYNVVREQIFTTIIIERNAATGSVAIGIGNFSGNFTYGYPDGYITVTP